MSAGPDVVAVRQPLFSDDVLARLRRVILHSRRMSTSGLSGEHRSRRKGPSPEFADFKAYTVGEDFRRPKKVFLAEDLPTSAPTTAPSTAAPSTATPAPTETSSPYTGQPGQTRTAADRICAS